jgi:hypothetical protein
VGDGGWMVGMKGLVVFSGYFEITCKLSHLMCKSIVTAAHLYLGFLLGKQVSGLVIVTVLVILENSSYQLCFLIISTK